MQKDFTLPVALITHLWVFFFLLFYPSVKMIDIKSWQNILFSHYYLSKVLDRSTFIDEKTEAKRDDVNIVSSFPEVWSWF